MKLKTPRVSVFVTNKPEKVRVRKKFKNENFQLTISTEKIP